MRKIKIIWDFKGPAGEQTAIHHAIHLKEYAETKQISFLEINSSKISDFHSIAFITVPEDYMLIIRDELKPHRAELA